MGQGNYNWCPGTHSSLCLRMSLTYKQVLIGDLPCEYLFHVGCKETHKHTHTETHRYMALDAFVSRYYNTSSRLHFFKLIYLPKPLMEIYLRCGIIKENFLIAYNNKI